MLIIKSIEELKTAYEMIEGLDIKMMMQEFIPGDDKHGVNYNLFAADGKPFVEFTAQKVRLSPPKIGFPRVIISKLINEVIEPGRKIISYLNYEGFACLEFKKHAVNGNYYLMEVNGRQNLSTPLAVNCGYNFPYLTYRYLIDRSLPKLLQILKKEFIGLIPVRILLRQSNQWKIEKLSVKRILYSLFKEKCPNNL